MPALITKSVDEHLFEFFTMNDIPYIAMAIQEAVIGSLHVHPLRHLKKEELKRRLNIAREIVIALRDQHYSCERIADKLDDYLIAALAGVNYHLLKRKSWAPSDATGRERMGLPAFYEIRDIQAAIAKEHYARSMMREAG